MYFFIEYDQPKGKLVSINTFADSERLVAMDARLARELGLRREGTKGRELVVLQSDSLETLKVTHGRYFKTVEELFDELVNAITSR